MIDLNPLNADLVLSRGFKCLLYCLPQESWMHFKMTITEKIRVCK